MTESPVSGDNSDTTGLQELLVSLGLLPSSSAQAPTGPFSSTEPEFQVLKSGVTGLARRVSGIIAAAGGIGAIWAGIEAYLAHSSPGLQIALVAAAAGIVALGAISVAVVISADLRARAIGTAGQYNARGLVAASFESIQSKGAAPQSRTLVKPNPGVLNGDLPGELLEGLLAVAAAGRQVQARLKANDALLYVTGIRYKSGNLRLRLSVSPSTPDNSDQWYGLADIDEFDTTL
jgi:hypothetical protein